MTEKNNPWEKPKQLCFFFKYFQKSCRSPELNWNVWRRVYVRKWYRTSICESESQDSVKVVEKDMA